MPRKPAYNYNELKQAVEQSFTYSDVLRKLGKIPAGGNHKIVKEYCKKWNINTSHFDPYKYKFVPAASRPLEEVLIVNSNYSRHALKTRLFKENLKQKHCEICGQGEIWLGKKMSLILDHINGVRDDNRLENLRIVCPNCNATLDTHCGKNIRSECSVCHQKEVRKGKRYCSQTCYFESLRNAPQIKRRKIERPPYEQLKQEVDIMGWSATGRKYGVSDNAIRKWIKCYENKSVLQSKIKDSAV